MVHVLVVNKGIKKELDALFVSVSTDLGLLVFCNVTFCIIPPPRTPGKAPYC